MGCHNDEKRNVFVAAHVLTHPICLVAQLIVCVFAVRQLLVLWQKKRISRGSLTCAMGYLLSSTICQIYGFFPWILVPAFNLARRWGAICCQIQAFFGWMLFPVAYMFLVLFWVERLRQTFKRSVFHLSDRVFALIQGFWLTMVFIEMALGTWAAVETQCAADSKVMDYNLFSVKTPHYCVSTKRGQLPRALCSAFGAIQMLAFQVTLGYMYVSRLKAVFIDSGKAKKEEIEMRRVDVGSLAQRVLKSEKIQKNLALASTSSLGAHCSHSESYAMRMRSVLATESHNTLTSLSGSELSTTVSTFTSLNSTERKSVGQRKQKRRPKLRTAMTQSELNYFRKSAIIALTSCVTTFVAAILVAAAGIFFGLYWDLLLNSLLIASSFEFGAGIYDRLFCCCQRVCVATVDRVTSMSFALENSAGLSPAVNN